jgi:hypothetical protein
MAGRRGVKAALHSPPLYNPVPLIFAFEQARMGEMGKREPAGWVAIGRAGERAGGMAREVKI